MFFVQRIDSRGGGGGDICGVVDALLPSLVLLLKGVSVASVLGGETFFLPLEQGHS